MGHTILVVDDQWSMQELARIVLRTAGYRVLLAGDTVTGLSLARTEHPDLTMLDVHMMNNDGSDFLANMRQDPQTAMIPVLLITTAPAAEEPASLPQADIARCLRKPFRPPELLHMVDRLLHREELPIAV